MNTKQLRVVGYVRVSSQQQADDGTSIERQIEKIQAYCNLKGHENLTILSDEGISGFKTTARKGYMTLIEMCSSHLVDLVIVYDLSRLSRSVKDTLTFIEDVIEKNHISFVSLMNDVDTTTPTGKAFLGITAIFNQLYRDEIAYKTKEALRLKQEKQEKIGGTIPYGYEIEPNTRGVSLDFDFTNCHVEPYQDNFDVKMKLIPNTKEQSVIREMMQLKASGASLREIAKHLTEQGIPTKTGGASWNHKVVGDILRRAS